MEVLTTIYTQVITWVSSMITLFTENPITLVGIVIGIVGAVAGLVGSILRGGGRRRRR